MWFLGFRFRLRFSIATVSLEQELGWANHYSFLTFVYDREKIQFLSFVMHLTERSGGDFGLVYRYYLSLEQELAAGKPLVF